MIYVGEVDVFNLVGRLVVLIVGVILFVVVFGLFLVGGIIMMIIVFIKKWRVKKNFFGIFEVFLFGGVF